MNAYIPLALYILFVSVFFKNRSKNLLFLLIFVPLLLFFGTRVDMGVDYEGYLQRYEMQHEWDLPRYLLYAAGGKVEPGFFFLIKILPSFNSLIFVCTLLVLVPVAIFFYVFIPRKYYPLAITLYIFNNRIFESFIAMRSGVVIGLFLLAIVLKYKGNLKSAIAVSLFSGTFHMSGFLLVPFLLLTNNYLKRYYRVFSLTIIGLIILALLSTTIFGEFVAKLSESFEQLSDYKGHVADTGYGMGFYLFSLVRVLFVFYILSLLRREVISDSFIWMAWMTILGYFVYMIQGIEVTYRFVYYFYLISIPLKCHIAKVDKSSYSKLYLSLSIVFIIYQFIGYTQLEQTQKFIWEYHSFLF